MAFRITMCFTLFRVLFLITVSGIFLQSSMEPVEFFEITEPSIKTHAYYFEVVTQFVNYLDVSESDTSLYEFCWEYSMNNDFNPAMISEECVHPDTGNNRGGTSVLTIYGLTHNTKYYLRLLLIRQYDDCSECSHTLGCTDGDCILDRTSVYIQKTWDLPWMSMPGGEYFFSFDDVDIYLNFSSAITFCEGEDSQLISITSSPKNTSVNQYLDNRGYCWIGLAFPNDVSSDDCSHCPDCVEGDANSNDCQLCGNCRNQWYWVDGAQSDYVSWGNGQPNENQPCAVVWNGDWYDSDCSLEHCFICHKAPNTTTTSTPTTTTPRSTTVPSRAVSTTASYTAGSTPLPGWQIAAIGVSVLLCHLECFVTGTQM